MAEARLAAGIGTRRCALGLDLGAPVLEVARRGFSSTFSNQMSQLGRWITTPVGADRPQPPPVLHLVDGLMGALAGGGSGEVSDIDPAGRIGVAAPTWFGWADRHHVRRLVDPSGSAEIVWASTPLVAAFATSAVGSAAIDAEIVVAVDLDIGVSAAVVSIDRSGVRERVAAGTAPSAGTRSEQVAAVIGELVASARARGMLAANRIVLIADGAASSSLVEPAIRALDLAWGECPVDVVRSRSDIARAVIELADMDGLDVVNVAPRAIGVLLDERTSSDLHVIVPRHEPTPLRVTARVDLGPDDGSDVFLDLYESPGAAHDPLGGDPRAHDLVMTAQLAGAGSRAGTDGHVGHGGPVVHGGGTADEIELVLEVGLDGGLRLQPITDVGPAWTCSWAPSAVVVSVAELTRAQSGWAANGNGPAVTIGARVKAREMASPIGLAEALGRAERLVSRRVGRPVAIRSVMALLGASDRDDTLTLGMHADHLDHVLASCDDDVGRTLRLALDVVRRTIEGPLGRVYAGGSAHDVSREIERVIEHLSVVIGAVTPAERNRLVFDAQLLGLEHDRARSLVNELIDELGVDTDGPPDEAPDRVATVVVAAQGMRLAGPGVQPSAGEAVMRVLLLD
ncbi:MAG: hypothetical protein HZB15_11405 [Actinobacteria bacterium]|nr:hypothetical protein [Actinomycetota bacterium]